MNETRVSTPEDFPHVAVYRRDGALGPLYGIVFENHEWPGGGADAGRMLVFWMCFFLFWPVSCAVVAKVTPPSNLVGFLVCCLVLAGVWYWANTAVRVKRVIELDKGADRLRIYGNGRIETEHSLQRLASLDIREHPNAVVARQERTQQPENRWRRKISQAEQQHCLFGYFGPGGANQVLLLSRVEWPCLNSLREVRQAILWAKEKMDREDDGSRDEGMNPPRR